MAEHFFKYRDYLGSIEIDTEKDYMHGKILFINDLVTYQADTVRQLRKEFENAVDDYLETCRTIKKEPDKPHKGSFNVRLGPELHRKAAMAAAQSGYTSLNDFVKSAVEDKTDGNQTVEHHHHFHKTTPYQAGVFFTAFNDPQEESPWLQEKVVSRKSH